MAEKEKRVQLNIRIDEEFSKRMDVLVKVIGYELGLKLSTADLIRMGVSLLEKKYAPALEAANERMRHWHEFLAGREAMKNPPSEEDYQRYLRERKEEGERFRQEQEAGRLARLEKMKEEEKL